MKTITMIAFTLALTGCYNADYFARLPDGVTPERQMEIKDMLESKGYHRVRFSSFEGRSYVSASRKEGTDEDQVKNRTGDLR